MRLAMLIAKTMFVVALCGSATRTLYGKAEIILGATVHADDGTPIASVGRDISITLGKRIVRHRSGRHRGNESDGRARIRDRRIRGTCVEGEQCALFVGTIEAGIDKGDIAHAT